MPVSARAIPVLTLGLLLTAGCGGGVKDMPTLYKATGKILVNGQPIEGATVAFHPVNLEKVARGGSGTTDSSGAFTIGTFTNGDGAIAGEYKVTVTKVKPKAGIDVKSLTPGGPPGAGGAPGSAAPGGANSEAYAKMMAPTGGAAASVTEDAGGIPEQYTKAETTTLIAVVDPQSPNNFNWDLK